MNMLVSNEMPGRGWYDMPFLVRIIEKATGRVIGLYVDNLTDSARVESWTDRKDLFFQVLGPVDDLRGEALRQAYREARDRWATYLYQPSVIYDVPAMYALV